MENKDLIGNIPIGETFQYKHKTIKVIKDVEEEIQCDKCIFEICPDDMCEAIACCSYQRDDGKNVYFELVK